MKGIEQFVQVDAATLGALKYAGTWNASTNTPTLASGVGVQGQYYVVSVAGTTNLDGVTNWGVGDWAVFNGTVWQRVEGGADGNFVNLSVTGTATVSGTAEFADGLAASPSITNIGDTNTGMYFPSADAIGIVTGGVNRIRVTSAGDVGIGTTTPAVKLDVANGFVVVGANSANPGVGGNIRFRDDTGASRWLNGLLGGAAATAYSIYDLVAGAERLNISSTGDVGIGTSSPAAKLDVVGSLGVRVNEDGAGTKVIQIRSNYAGLGPSIQVSTADPLLFLTNNTERMRITSTGDVGIGTSTPLQQLHLSSASATGMQITYQGVGASRIGVAAGNLLTFGLDTSNGTTTRMAIDSSGNLGVGVTPSAWSTNRRALQIGGGDVAALGLAAQYSEIAHNTISTVSGPQYATSNPAAVVDFNNAAAGGFAWRIAPSGTAGNAISFTQAMTLDSSGNLGLGVTPQAWGVNNRVFELAGASTAHVVAYVNGLSSGTNYYINSVGSALYSFTGQNATRYVQNTAGQHQWFTAPSGTAGNAISFTQAMTLDASGNLGVGTSSPGARLHINSGGVDEVARFEGSGEPFISLYDNGVRDFYLFDSTEIRLWGQANKAMVFATNNNERARIPAAGGMVVGTAAIATNATDGFLYVPTCAGTPTGTPTTQTGTAPIVIDTTNNKLYFYSGGAWRDAGP